MARISGVNLPNKPVAIALTYIFGIGRTSAVKICEAANVAGEVRANDLGDDELARIRNKHIGFVFQLFNLIPRISALRNVELPMIYSGVPPAERLRLATQALQRVAIADRAQHIPSQLSGGQQQRVAIARALVNNPQLLVADEPTGSLDSKTGHEIMELFSELNKAGTTIVMVTHEEDIAACATRIIRLKDGIIATDSGAQ